MKLPESVDLRRDDIPVFDQGDLGSSAACAVATAVMYQQQQQKDEPSRLFLYCRET